MSSSLPAKPLVIAEKPSAARAIAEALGGFRKQNGYLESPRYRITWALGHLVELAAPEEYDPKWKRWSLATLPILPERFELRVAAETKAQFETVVRLARSAPELINACDAGREGELIFRYIITAAGLRQPVRRLWVSSLTPEAIRQGFAALRPQADYDRLYQSALCRAQGDWLVGINATRAFSARWGELLSVGRVQTPTLALLVRREQEIEAFKPEPYWEIWAEFAASGGRAYRGKWFGAEGDRVQDEHLASLIAARTRGQTGVVEQVTERPVVERPPQLFDLTSLQREANRRFGLTAAATLKAAQWLYEAKLITYPRTDSRYLSRDLVKTLPGLLRTLGARPEYAALVQGAQLDAVHPGNRRVVDDSKVTDHHAIIPTAERAPGLTGVNEKIYDLIARRFLAQFYPAAQYLELEVVTRVGAEPVDRFRTRGRRELAPGWRVVEPPRKPQKGEEEDDAAPVPALREGEHALAEAVKARKCTTKPPRRYTEASLLSAMELAGREVEDEALREAMKARGLGTPATRAAIIERLKQVGYITLEKKSLVPTEKGRRLVRLAEEAGAQALLSAELTGDWEKRIADIQQGTDEPERFMDAIRELTVQVVDSVRSAEGAPSSPGVGEEITQRAAPSAAAPTQSRPVLSVRCPRCGGEITRTSKGWVCSAEGCETRVPSYLLGKVIDAPLAEALLTKGRTPLISGFISSRTGRSFSAYLVMQGEKVGFEFPPDRPRKRRRRTASRTGKA